MEITMNSLLTMITLKTVRRSIVAATFLLALSPKPANADGPDGGALFVSNNCVACHQATGVGVPGAFPALAGNPIVAGDQDTLIKILLVGPEKVLPADSPKFTGKMPPVPQLSDAKIAAILTYIRAKFGNGAAAVTEDEVTKVRASLSQ